MRDYLFRGKRKDNGEWVEGSLILTTSVKEKTYIVDSCYCYDECIDEDGYADFDRLNAFEVIPETVGQFTGLSDKNGKKIFEGDIVFCNSTYVNEMYYILFENLSFCYGELNNKYLTPIDDAEFGLYVSGCKLIGYEVIGNIHDNPELLKGGEENGKMESV